LPQSVWASPSQDLIVNFDPSIQELPRFGSTSSSQEWQESAERLFDHENYREAAFAFRRARLTQQERVAKAYQRRKEAEDTITKPERKQSFKAAAKSFLDCAKTAPEMGDFKAFHGIAGLCSCQAEEYAEAAAAYVVAEEYDVALQMCRKGGLFDQGVEVIKNYERDIKDKAGLDSFKDLAKLFYLKEKKLRQALLLNKAYVGSL
jgi:DNA repair ATPase RecN